MTTTKELASIGQLADIKAVLDSALATNASHGEVCGTVAFATSGKAVNWRQRAYRFRKLWREHRDINSPYERLTLPKLEPGETSVTIKMTGVPAVFTPAQISNEDPLLSVARNLAEDGI